MKNTVKLMILFLCLVFVTVSLFSCGGNGSQQTTTQPPAQYNYIVDGNPTSSAPDGNYVVYARHTEDESVWLKWDYSAKKIANEDIDAAKVNVYMYNVGKLYSSVEEMVADTTLTANTRVGTTSYYASVGRGAAIYDIVETASAKEITIELSNGLLAKLVPFTVGEEKVITVDMVGAHGDGETSDNLIIDQALNYRYHTTLEFESECYMQTASIRLQRGDIKVNGKGASIHNRYESGIVEGDFSVSGRENKYIENIVFCHLEFNCTEDDGKGALHNNAGHGQFSSTYTKNLHIYECRFVNYITDPLRQVGAVSIHNYIDVIFENNTIINLSGARQHSGGLWFWSDGDDFSRVSQNAIVRNNYIEKTGHDETLAFFMGAFDGILVENNTIYTHDEPDGYASAHAIGFGVWDCPTTVKNAVFRNNKVDVVSNKDAMMFSCVENIAIYDNEITLRQNASEPVANGVFRVTYHPENYTAAGITSVTQTNVEIYNNKITVYNSVEIPIAHDSCRSFNVHDNEYTCNIIE